MKGWRMKSSRLSSDIGGPVSHRTVLLSMQSGIVRKGRRHIPASAAGARASFKLVTTARLQGAVRRPRVAALERILAVVVEVPELTGQGPLPAASAGRLARADDRLVLRSYQPVRQVGERIGPTAGPCVELRVEPRLPLIEPTVLGRSKRAARLRPAARFGAPTRQCANTWCGRRSLWSTKSATSCPRSSPAT
jgi:hypothetical protein